MKFQFWIHLSQNSKNRDNPDAKILFHKYHKKNTQKLRILRNDKENSLLGKETKGRERVLEDERLEILGEFLVSASKD